MVGGGGQGFRNGLHQTFIKITRVRRTGSKLGDEKIEATSRDAKTKFKEGLVPNLGI